MLGMRVLSGSTVTTRYFHADNLGSIAVITDETGNVVERDGYDAWGKRRFPNGADDPTGSLTSQTTRGFTAQEELHDVGLVHLNGRVYDPLVARMMSADPMVDDPMNGQTWNRYSYVGNNPLTFTDPSGYCFLGCGSWSNLGKMQLGTTFRQNPMLGSIVEIAAAGICGMMTAGGCIPQVVAVLASATVAGITSGRLGKDVLRPGSQPPQPSPHSRWSAWSQAACRVQPKARTEPPLTRSRRLTSPTSRAVRSSAAASSWHPAASVVPAHSPQALRPPRGRTCLASNLPSVWSPMLPWEAPHPSLAAASSPMAPSQERSSI
jgi:RHS repeat-associated protein